MAAHLARKVLVAGGGVAGLETVLALRSLAPQRFEIELLAPERHFTYRPRTLGAPFQRTAPARVELAAIARDSGFAVIRDALDTVDAHTHEVHTQDGARLGYDVLVLALGTRPFAAVEGAIPFRGSHDLGAVTDALETIAAGPARVAYIARSAVMWTLPLYELALHTVAWAKQREVGVEVLLATAELAPVEAFGADSSARVADLLEHAGVHFLPGAVVDRVHDGALHMRMRASIPVAVAVALPYLAGPAVTGLPHDRRGFTPVDATGRVRGVEDVYAVGGMTDRPLKQGGLGAQQADVAAGAIAAAANVPVRVQPYRPVLRGILRNGGPPLYLRNPPEDNDLLCDDVGVGAVHLSRYLDAQRELRLGR
jgi:sulfide:quinone oxidoreductase